jgi:hypothetical protein
LAHFGLVFFLGFLVVPRLFLVTCVDFMDEEFFVGVDKLAVDDPSV